MEDLKNHPFFASLNWQKCYNKQLIPPFIPVVNSEDDLANIDKMFTREPARETPAETSGLGAGQFSDFTYADGLSTSTLKKSKT